MNGHDSSGASSGEDVSGELPPTPARIDKFQIVRLIGGGGGGVVYEAVHPELKRRVAVKILHPSLTDNPAAVKRFLREGQATARIDHPHVVDVADVGLHHGQPFLVMELLAGADLKAHLARRGPLSLAETLDVMLPVISAVSAAHEAGVIHRDLKPQNIFVAIGRGGRTHPKVLDFGVAKLIDEARGRTSWTGGEVVMGTLSYMAPEQARGEPLDARVDQYALGLILHECLTGKRVHEGKDQVSIVESIVHGEVPQPGATVPGLPLAFEEALMRALSRDPAGRFATVHELGCALLPFASQRMRTIWNMVFEPRRSTRLLAASAVVAGTVDANDDGRQPAAQAATVAMTVVDRAPAPDGDDWAFAQETRSPRRRAPGWLLTAATLAVVAVAGLAAVSLHRGLGPAARVRVRPAQVIADAGLLPSAVIPAARPAKAALVIIPPEVPAAAPRARPPDRPPALSPDPPTREVTRSAAPLRKQVRRPHPRVGHDRRPAAPHPARSPYRLGANQSPIITD